MILASGAIYTQGTAQALVQVTELLSGKWKETENLSPAIRGLADPPGRHTTQGQLQSTRRVGAWISVRSGFVEMPALPRWADKAQPGCTATFKLLSRPPLGTGGAAVPLSQVGPVPVSHTV